MTTKGKYQNIKKKKNLKNSKNNDVRKNMTTKVLEY